MPLLLYADRSFFLFFPEVNSKPILYREKNTFSSVLGDIYLFLTGMNTTMMQFPYYLFTFKNKINKLFAHSALSAVYLGFLDNSLRMHRNFSRNSTFTCLRWLLLKVISWDHGEIEYVMSQCDKLVEQLQYEGRLSVRVSTSSVKKSRILQVKYFSYKSWLI